MIEVKYNQQSYNRLIGKLEDLASQIKDLRPIWDKFFDYYRSDIIETYGFNARGKIFGEIWQNYSPKYLKWKRKHYRGKGFLILTGEMFRAATSDLEKVASKTKLTMIVNNKLINYHQSGTEKMVARPVVMKRNKTIPNRAILWLITEMKKYIKGEWK